MFVSKWRTLALFGLIGMASLGVWGCPISSNQERPGEELKVLPPRDGDVSDGHRQLEGVRDKKVEGLALDAGGQDAGEPMTKDSSVGPDVSVGPEEGGGKDAMAQELSPDEVVVQEPVPEKTAREQPPEKTWVPPCQSSPCPTVIGAFPYQNTKDTSKTNTRRFSSYSCAPSKNEGGPEYMYVFRLKESGTVIAAVKSASGADIDIHLLTKDDPQSCLVRHDKAWSYHLKAGVYYIAADTFVSSGKEKRGGYTLYVHFISDTSKCGMRSDAIPRIGTSTLLKMPATGPLVREAHLLTAEEHQQNVKSGYKNFPKGWPDHIRHNIQQHYTLSQKASGYVMQRKEPWAPCCEPSNYFGQGSSAKPPAIAEAWYLNMRWKKAPKRGARYLIFNPYNGKAVVAAAGYENGPGNLAHIGGACEEVHHYLGTGHLSLLTLGEMSNQTLSYGPIKCSR